MAQKALLIWCVGSALACGTAALATTSLWRAPPKAGVAADRTLVLPDIAPPLPVIGLDAPADAILPLAGIAFYEVAIAPAPIRGSFDAAPSLAATLAALPREGFTEIRLEPSASNDRLSVRPPPRPAFLARRDPSTTESIAELSAGTLSGRFETPAASPFSAFGDALRGMSESAKPERVIHSGVASWYGPGFHGRKTASGERFDQYDLTAAHRTLPFGSRVKVVDERTGRSIVVRINDRGPFKHNRVIDLSKAAAEALGVGGLSRVKLVSAN